MVQVAGLKFAIPSSSRIDGGAFLIIGGTFTCCISRREGPLRGAHPPTEDVIFVGCARPCTGRPPVSNSSHQVFPAYITLNHSQYLRF